MARHPQLVAFDVTEAIRKQALAIQGLLETRSPEELTPIVDATADLVNAWRNYQEALDPEGWVAALAEMHARGLPVDLPFLTGGSKT